ncbi:TonB-dependent receptor [Bacteroides caecicola]|uniref:TonB-dependent receptor n=2 Tax=Bacteroidaceae TaxID=815 RepID=A0ABS2FAA6_9BACE|nr:MULTISPECIES: TonB-dependent receptor [Bacteroidaceae]MBD8001890.1 TonB-dependent receptor [Phocaeicola faecium]MBM6806988.1 TonB-dependent receptor [Bacteroides caecicola]
MKTWVLGILLMAISAISAFAQSGSGRATVTGTVLDGGDKSPVMQATVQILSLKDSTMVKGNVSDLDGNFALSVRPGKYLLKISYIGYTTFFRQIEMTRNKPRLNVGNIELQADAIMLGEAVVVAQAPEVTAAEDTLVYNSSAYRVPEGSALEELVKKLPGAEVDENGKITINGKEIKKIMIDGKEFFADDPNIAMKNLPVNIIDKVRAYDKQSDLARATGIDDGEEETVLDLSVKPGMNKGWFGNADLAAGTEDRYSGKIMLNRFWGDNQFTVIGSMNNVNDQGYPGGGGGFRWGGQNGLTAIKMGGFNFSTTSEKLETGGSVNFNYKDADIISKQASETFVSSDNSSFQNALIAQRNKNTALTADFRIEWRPDTMTMLLVRPRLSYGDTDNTESSNSGTFNAEPQNTTDELIAAIQEGNLTDLMAEENIVNTIIRNSLSKSSDFNVGGSVMFNRRLGKAGRNINFRGTYNYTNSSSEQFSTSETEYFQMTDEERLEILNRYISTPTLNNNFSARVSYSEPIFKGGFLQFSYNFQYRYSTTDNSTYTMPNDWTIDNGYGGEYTGVLDKENSKSAHYTYYNHQAELALRWIREKMRLNVGVSFQPQKTELSYKKGDLDTVTVRNVFNFTPTLDFRYKFNKTSQLRINYRGRSSQPSMTDLLPVEDTTDPLNIRRGNPGLKPSFTNSFRAFYNTFNTETQRGMVAHVSFSNTMNSVSSRRVYNETTGGYITTPENINGNWNLFSMLGSNTALRNKKYTINTFTTASYNNIVSYISDNTETTNDDRNKTRQLRLGERLRGTYRTDWWEVSLNGSLNYTHSRNNYQEQNNMDTYDFSYGASTNIRLPWNMSIATDLSQNSRRGYSDNSMNRDELIWNAQISQDFLKGNAATVSIQFYDILRNQSNVSRAITAAMRSDTEYNAIYSYCMVHFIYRLNLFGGKNGGPSMGGPHGRGPGFGPRPHRF